MSCIYRKSNCDGKFLHMYYVKVYNFNCSIELYMSYNVV